MGGLLAILAAFLWCAWFEERAKRRRRESAPQTRDVEARVSVTRERIAQLEPRLGQPRHRPQPRERGFECIERVD